MEKIAIFGSAFNPPSLGHKSVIDSLAHFDKILLVPSIAHAWGKEMLDFDTRCQLVEAFISDLLLDQVELSLVEKGLFTPGESVTTYAVLSQLQKQHPEAELTFVIGPDNFFKFSSFYKSDEITERWSVMACPEKVKIRSTDIRHALQNGSNVAKLSTKSVTRILQDSELYTII
ncbi:MULTISPECIES: nicotinate-nicotinamide nucleotide adenylyltransferase [Vibrio]|uniref:nicotinate-nucleotide adenylyltransferase n=3 Tax=Vibrio cyclitrophicus TaxID=47951 RepID=A0A7Z1S0X8_9VIBR|nr:MULTISPECIES: nicotinate-nicotinamide nucleotide adenylyltransferase [Vibrio]KNH10959.1 nicotinic acid mononucleotide adenylyltransferase [Vibrio lentus]MBY7659654.1 nicotinate-nicotinamide nucleotide adenylyltransferase [Vibrio atlanticus]ERM58103.1 Nicotinate-nucleotide adenylyltransferase [Vibrio cyclitrophicus FF75]KAA8602519.1 Nicotinate-nucleotide adenylyltransferase [Vibrio cyclitrophicus]MBE8558047.1 nicotinate-nicotinamide nucleotide adenylyltransferase [Vibrio sp. OPT24]